MSISLRADPLAGRAPEPPAPPAEVVPPRRRRAIPALIAVGVPLVIGVIHVLVVARHYYVGSFDDDASYILSAKAILAGNGLTARLPSGAILVGAYPPGYSLLLVPLLWISKGTLALRGLSLACYAALFPLTWYYLGRRRFPEPLRVAVLALLALSPVLATFGSMVMAETPFLVLFLVLLLLLDRWDGSTRVLSPAAIGVIVTLAGLVWLKEAAIAMVAGVVVWLALCRQVRKAAAVAAGSVVLLAPIAIARLMSGVPVTGSRYSQELGGYYTGTLASRLTHVFSGAGHYVTTALPASVVPSGDPASGWARDVLIALGGHVAVLCLIGLVVCIRRYRDAAVVVVLFYLAETLLWPYINERRVILVLPVVLTWYAVGAWTVGAWLLGWWKRKKWACEPLLRPGMAAVCAVLVLAPLVSQFPRDYLFALGQNSSQPQGSPYAAILARLGSPGDVVETDYESTVALVSGHRTANSAFVASLTACPQDATRAALSSDNAGYLLVGALNKPGQVDSPCLLGEATSEPWAVRLFRTERDSASVFELIGPGTAHPYLTDLTTTAAVSGSSPVVAVPVAPNAEGDNPGTVPTTLATAGAGAFTWDWGRATTVQQVSVGAAGATSGTGAVSVDLRLPSGVWMPVAGAGGAVGDDPGTTPFLLASFPDGMTATALRVVVQGGGQVSAMDVHALAQVGAA